MKDIGSVLKKSFAGFVDDNVTKLAGSLAYTIVFSLAPLLMICIAIGSIFYGKEAVEGQLFLQIAGVVGNDVASFIQGLIKAASLNGRSTLSVVIGVIILVFSSTALFAEVQSSINQIWRLKTKPKKGYIKLLKDRVLSFSFVVSLGFLLLVTLIISTLIESMNSYLMNSFPGIAVIIFYVLDLVINFVVVSCIFAVIFKVLPDANVQWKHVRAGAIATAVLFMLGKFLIFLYIEKAKIGSPFGAAGSIVVLLTWVYFSALILYFGAEFTKFYALQFGDEIKPRKYAVSTKIVEIEKDTLDISGQKIVVEESHNLVSTAKNIVLEVQKDKVDSDPPPTQ